MHGSHLPNPTGSRPTYPVTLPPTSLHSLQSPSNLLPHANEFWSTNHPNELFGNTYNTPTPSLWFQQSFALNLFHSLIILLRNTISVSISTQATPTPKFGPEYTLPSYTLKIHSVGAYLPMATNRGKLD